MPLTTGLQPGEHVISPRAFAFVLAFLGNLCLLLAAIQHRLSLQALRTLGLKTPYSAASILAAFLALLGISVLLIVLLGFCKNKTYLRHMKTNLIVNTAVLTAFPMTPFGDL